jgi:hypothetical protein
VGDVERLTKELATVERQLASDEAALRQRATALEELRERTGPGPTANREKLELAHEKAMSRVAVQKQRRDDLVTRIERERQPPELELGL